MDEVLEIKVKQAAITPFWHKLPFFFAFPFRFGPLVFLACIVAASALAGAVLGPFGLVFRGFLAYLGLRYAFNVLELFSKGRFEGESMDHSLWGPERRPAKLGLVLALFIVAALQAGNAVVASRLSHDSAAQELALARYKQDHAQELADLEREREAWQRRVAQAQADVQVRPADVAADAGDPDEEPSGAIRAAEPAEEPPAAAPSRESMIEAASPLPGDPLWLRLLPAWYWIALALASLVLPSAAVIIALEDSLPRALNPLNVLHLMQAMGRAYFMLWAFFLAIAGSRQLALTAGEQWPPMLRLPLEMGLATYLALVLFAIMGYALYQYHQELHLDVDVDFDEHRQAGGAEAIAAAGSARTAITAKATPTDPLERKVQTALAQGNVKEAIAEVKDFMRYDKLDAALNTRLHDLLALQGDAQTIRAHGQQWLTALSRAGRGGDVVAAFRKLQAIDPTFAAEDGSVALPAATAAVQQRDYPLAATLLRHFDKRFPGHPDIPGVYFLSARLMSEQARQHDKAARLLRGVLSHFPDHELAGDVRAYLQALEATLARPVGEPVSR